MERRLAWSAALGLLVVAALGLAGEHFWIFDLVSHFRLHVATLSGLVAVASVLRRVPGAALLAGALAVGLVGSSGATLPLAASAEGAVHDREPAPRLRVLVSNVSLTNLRPDLAAQLRGRHAPDVIGFLEVDEAWTSTLGDALPDYPHRLLEPRSHHFGLALFSRLPLTRSEVLHVNEEHHPALRVSLRVAGELVDLVLAHAHPPLSARTAALRDRQIAALGRIRAQSQRPFVLMGDLNATPWSAPFRRLVTTAGLRDTRRGFGNQPTWPAPLARLGIPVDHVLVSPEWTVLDRRTGPPVGSDHLPVFAELQLRAGGTR